MNAFAALLTALERARSTGRKLELLTAYFREAPPGDAAWALHLLTGRRPQRIASGPELRRWLGEATGLSEAVLEATYAHVGDLAETLALVLPAPPLGTTVPATSLQALLEGQHPRTGADLGVAATLRYSRTGQLVSFFGHDVRVLAGGDGVTAHGHLLMGGA